MPQSWCTSALQGRDRSFHSSAVSKNLVVEVAEDAIGALFKTTFKKPAQTLKKPRPREKILRFVKYQVVEACNGSDVRICKTLLDELWQFTFPVAGRQVIGNSDAGHFRHYPYRPADDQIR